MKRYMAVFIGTPSTVDKAASELTEEQKMAGMQAWGKWVEDHAGAIVDHGSPLGKTKLASPAGIEDSRNALTAWTIVEAESHEAAARMFENHPHFTIFPGEGVEIMECLPMPGM